MPCTLCDGQQISVEQLQQHGYVWFALQVNVWCVKFFSAWQTESTFVPSHSVSCSYLTITQYTYKENISH
jgi:hypothetical protein